MDSINSADSMEYKYAENTLYLQDVMFRLLNDLQKKCSVNDGELNHIEIIKELLNHLDDNYTEYNENKRVVEKAFHKFGNCEHGNSILKEVSEETIQMFKECNKT